MHLARSNPTAADPCPDEPPPQAPEPPQEGDCCESGCEDCVWTRYQAARRAYEADYAEWLARHGHRLFGD